MQKLVLAVFLIASSLASVVMPATPVQAQATRTWVSGVGDDANPCSRTAPCKTFAGAISKTAPSGEIDCLDPGGFGALTITKAITIDCNGGGFGSVLVSGTNGLNIVAGANDVITIRHLAINGLGTGLVGINITSAAAVHVRDCFIFGFRSGLQSGIQFLPSGLTDLYLVDTAITDNGSGIAVQPSGTGSGRLVVERTKFEHNTFGVVINTAGSSGGGISAIVRDSVVAGSTNTGVIAIASGTPAITMALERLAALGNGTGVNATGNNATIRIGNSVISGNNTGVSNSGGSITSYKNNEINGNGADGTPLPQVGLN
jgi:hypothetical protein